MGGKVILAVAIGVALIVALTVLYGLFHWRSATRMLRARLEAGRGRLDPASFSRASLVGLPAPVQRYLSVVLREGQPLLTAVDLLQEGFFNTREDRQHWAPFTARQRVVIRRPGFCWDARIRMGPGVCAYVHDAYVAGEGLLRVAILGFADLFKLEDRSDLAQAELMRFLAEGVLYPTVFLPGQGVVWEANGEASAKASITDGMTEAALIFHFDDEGLVRSVRAEGRGRMVDGKVIPTPWEGRWWDYEVRKGMRIPLEGEAAWIGPSGPQAYWRGRVVGIDGEFAV